MALAVLLVVFLIVVLAIAFSVFPAHKVVEKMYGGDKKKPPSTPDQGTRGSAGNFPNKS